MKRSLLIIMLLTSSLVKASDEVVFDSGIAIERAKVELKEFAFISGYGINEKYLSGNAKVLVAKTQDGSPIIKVLFDAGKGSYEVTFSLDKDGWLERRSVGDSAYSIEQIEKEFNKNPSFYLP